MKKNSYRTLVYLPTRQLTSLSTRQLTNNKRPIRLFPDKWVFYYFKSLRLFAYNDIESIVTYLYCIGSRSNRCIRIVTSANGKYSYA